MFLNSCCQNCKSKYYKYDLPIIDIFLKLNNKYFLLFSKIFFLKDVNKHLNNYSNEIIINENMFYNKIILKIDDNVVSTKKISKNKTIQYVLEVINYLLGTNKNYISLHSSGFLINNDLFLFIGSSGSGKTTAVSYLLKKINNSIFFSDDRVFIDEDLYAIGLPNALSIKRGTKELMNIDDKTLLGPFKKNKINDFWYYTIENKKCNYILDLKKLNVYFLSVKYRKNFNIIEHSKMDNIEKIKLLVNNCYDISSNTASSQSVIKEIIKNTNIYKIIYNDLNDLYMFIDVLIKKKYTIFGDNNL